MFNQDPVNAPLDELPSKICSSCGQLCPLSEFRRRVAGEHQRHTECRRCYNASMRERRQSLRANELARSIGRLSRRSIRPSEVELIASAMMQRFGGLQRFSAEWKFAIDEAASDSVQLRFKLNSMLALVKIFEVASKRVPAQTVESLSDDELEIEINRLVDARFFQCSNR